MGVTTDFGMGQTDVNELSLVNSAVNEVIGETADTYRELSCWVNQMSTEYRLTKQLTLRKYHMNSEQLTLRNSYEQLTADAKEII
ncbi:hypothetical protein F511_25260 [Dorcoceras hygrometricum]|uniref:Uncharacterized protein n=1 Tax=Dorcoceras hygrometricum TaxID=472368 RepID=A0A2Z7B200_9LAMI|nr:hypothetical protein F511_25260 [Dorcoceras hygrometricum]